jgi:Zn finger protein HypA/HybF involved in hydrogenase expression
MKEILIEVECPNCGGRVEGNYAMLVCPHCGWTRQTNGGNEDEE